ncbi:MAG: 4a-hydroxytetrahydrobiopterin dehydratase [bacterium]|nr:4a-hydroxytetrahydrobiopterin dehydratase [bacterium]
MLLREKKCVPCEGGTQPLTAGEVRALLPHISSAWSVEDDNVLVREYAFKDFKEALMFVNKVGAIAEKEDHHPDILLYGYNRVRIRLSTHAIGGLSENDFILATKIDADD